jgi:hypothetical protein
MAEDAKKVPWFWIKDDKGSSSVTVTFTAIAFLVTTLAYMVSIVEKLHVFGQEVAFRTFDVAACSAYFVPILTLYFGRKFTKAKFGQDGQESPAPGTPSVVPPPSGA